jgi:hypothetical protein
MAGKGKIGSGGAAAIKVKGTASIRVLTGSAAAATLAYLGYLTYLVVNCMQSCAVASQLMNH